MELGGVGDEQDVAVYVDGGSDRPEEEGEDVARLVRRNEEGDAEVLHLRQTEKKRRHKLGPVVRTRCLDAGGPAHVKHGFGLFGQRHVVYPDGEAEGVGEEDGSVHRVHGAVPDVEQSGRLVEAQVAAGGQEGV